VKTEVQKYMTAEKFDKEV